MRKEVLLAAQLLDPWAHRRSEKEGSVYIQRKVLQKEGDQGVMPVPSSRKKSF